MASNPSYFTRYPIHRYNIAIHAMYLTVEYVYYRSHGLLSEWGCWFVFSLYNLSALGGSCLIGLGGGADNLVGNMKKKITLPLEVTKTLNPPPQMVKKITPKHIKCPFLREQLFNMLGGGGNVKMWLATWTKTSTPSWRSKNPSTPPSPPLDGQKTNFNPPTFSGPSLGILKDRSLTD